MNASYLKQYLIALTPCFLVGCFGPVDPTNPLDHETSVEQQSRANLILKVFMPTSLEPNGYLSLRSYRTDEVKRLYLEDFTLQGSVTESDGTTWAFYQLTVAQVEPGIYALHSSTPSLELKGQVLFELSPASQLDLEFRLSKI